MLDGGCGCLSSGLHLQAAGTERVPIPEGAVTGGGAWLTQSGPYTVGSCP